MNITKSVLSGRDEALLYGDYSTYRASLSRRLLSCRKRLGRTTRKGAKYVSKDSVSAQDIKSSPDFIHLLLLKSERAWAHAMGMKATHSGDSKGITGPTRSHIVSRLHKASTIVDDLIIALSDRSTSGATSVDILEARAYAASLTGAEQFEKQGWEACIRSYSEAWVIYSALSTSTKSDMFKDLLSGTIEPSIRYAAYQMRMPRTVAVPSIAKKFFPRTDPQLVSDVNELDPAILRDSAKARAELPEAEEGSRSITWRSRTVDLEDATIVTAVSAISAAKKTLSERLSSLSSSFPKERAAAYDDILIKSQDAVDVTKDAIDELVAEGVGQGDKRMQSLQITRTAVSYDMISWRIGRNRVLTGDKDGALKDSSPTSKVRQAKKARTLGAPKEEGLGRQMARLREKVVMYDSTLQSLTSIRELPGVAADTKFLEELDAKYMYFRALKCLAIARSHSILSEYKNALALLVLASDISNQAVPTLSSIASTSTDSPPNIEISPSAAKELSIILNGELQRHRALVELANLTQASSSQKTSVDLPLIDRLHTYPSNPVDLTNLVTYPPKLEPIPVKPLFFDVAWNYIEYPGRTPKLDRAEETISKTEETQESSAQQQKKGWFGFGRS